MGFKALLAAAAIALAAPLSAQAVTIDFRADVGNTGSDSLSFDALGISDAVTVSGFNESGVAANINQTSGGQAGLGVQGFPEAGRLASLAGSAGTDDAESFVITFSQAFITEATNLFGSLTVTELFLTDQGSDTDGETFSVALNGVEEPEVTTTGGNGDAFAFSFLIDETSDFITVFGTSDDDGLGGGGPNNQGGRLQSLSVAVPLPAPAFLLLSSLAGIGFVVRRRTK